MAVTAVYPLPPEAIVEQVRAVVDDIGVDAVKIGMLGNVETIEAVVDALELRPAGVPVVLDPVMVAESGGRLLDEEAERGAARAAAAAGRRGHAQPDGGRGAGGLEAGTAPADLARAVHALGPGAVVVTGGHREEASDVFFDGERLVEIPGERHPGGAAHGSGCTHSSALAAHLALGLEPLEAARRAKTSPRRRWRAGCGSRGGPGPGGRLLEPARGRRGGRPGRRPAGWHNRGSSIDRRRLPLRTDWSSNQVPAHEAGSWRGAPRRGGSPRA